MNYLKKNMLILHHLNSFSSQGEVFKEPLRAFVR